jgi:hypothetical protein
MTAELRRLKARVRRLEDAVGKGQRNCASCRYMVTKLWPDPRRAVPDDLFMAECQSCHSKYAVSLDGYGESDREMLRLVHSFTLEDQYVDPKAHAFRLLCETRFAPNAKTRELGRTLEARSKKDPGVRTFVRLRDESIRLEERKRQRLRAKYGDDPFPEQRKLIESVRNRGRRSPGLYADGFIELEKEETERLVCAELEKIIWGGVRAETASDIKRLGEEIDELVRAAQAEAERRRAESGPTTRELLNRRRAQSGLPPLQI